MQSDTLESQSLLIQASDKLTDFPFPYYFKNKKDKNFIIPVFNLVIKMNEGTITGVTW
jgi:hypothetical protein